MLELMLRVVLVILTAALTTMVCDRRRRKRGDESRDGTLLHIAAMVATRPCECLGDCDTCAPCLARQVLGIEEPRDGGPAERLAEAHESIRRARIAARGAGEHELAAALHAILLLHLTGSSLATVLSLVAPEQPREAVN